MGRYESALKSFVEGNDVLIGPGKPGEPISLLAAAIVELTLAEIIDVSAADAHLDAMFKKLAQVEEYSQEGNLLHDLAEALKKAREIQKNTFDFSARARKEELRRVRERLEDLEKDNLDPNNPGQLWEVFLFSGLLYVDDDSIEDEDNQKDAKDKFIQAAAIRSHVPLITHFLAKVAMAEMEKEAKRIDGRVSAQEERQIIGAMEVKWSEYIDDFVADPIGYYARATLNTLRLDKHDRLRGDMAFNVGAERDLGKAIDRSEDFWQARYALSRIYEESGRYREAFGQLQKIFDRLWDLELESSRVAAYEKERLNSPPGSEQRDPFIESGRTATQDYLRVLVELNRINKFSQVYTQISEWTDDVPELKSYYYKYALQYLGLDGNVQTIADFIDTEEPQTKDFYSSIESARWLGRSGQFDRARSALAEATDFAATQLERNELDKVRGQNDEIEQLVNDPKKAIGSSSFASIGIDVLRLRIQRAISDDVKPFLDSKANRDLYSQVISSALERCSHKELVWYFSTLATKIRTSQPNVDEAGLAMVELLESIKTLEDSRVYRYLQVLQEETVREILEPLDKAAGLEIYSKMKEKYGN